MKRTFSIIASLTFLTAIFATTLPAFAVSLSLGTINPNATVSAGNTISFQLTTADFSANPSYILSDTFPGSTLSNSNINKQGVFSWTSNITDIGIHNVTFTAGDSYGNKSSVTQAFVITQPSPVTIQAISPGTDIFANNVLSFQVTAPGFNNPSFSVRDSFYNSSINSLNINSFGNFNWKPSMSDVGTHNLSVYVTSGNRTESVFQTITVDGVSIQNVSATSLKVGTPLSFSLTTYGMNSPTYQVSDSARNNTINSTNVLNNNNFNWVPQAQDIGTHTITATAVDSNGNVSTTQITVTVNSAETIPTPIVTPTPSTQTSNPTSVPSTAKFTLELKVGSKGSEVTALQTLLKKLKFYNGPITGTFGAQTKAGVIAFQKANKISAIGIVGPATRKILNTK